ncbi:OST-HTH/LOTUS domain-containing protein [Comamonas koreensis]|uniref:OST-HTH/LOTUS domain-containing protein n=1 Tax=Comamonas koreensis TaxID=160825 RepID=UPI002E7BA36A|nr:OST-HTH/LOTUS domain-containing protein [Comamonas koreensis]
MSLLAGDTSEGKVGLGLLGQYLKRMDPGFSPQTFGHSGLLSMVKTYDLLAPSQDESGHWSVSLVPKIESPSEEKYIGYDSVGQHSH